METTVKQRLTDFIQSEGLSVREFERRCDLSNAYVATLKNSPSAKKLATILAQFPQLDRIWLITGEGEMYRPGFGPGGEVKTVKDVKPEKSYTVGQPYFNVDFLGGFDLTVNDQTANPDYLISFPPLNRPGVLWCNVSGHSMEPEISNGDIIALVDQIFGIERPERRRPASFVAWCREQNDLTNDRATTKERREVVLRAVEAFGRLRTFDDITPARVKAFDDYLRRTGNRTDYTLKSNYHKVLHYFCRLAISAELIDRDPYAVFRPRPGRSKERQPLTAAELSRLRSAVLPERLARVRDLFIFCAYTGLAYSDSQLVEFFDIVERSGARFIDATRRKTGTRFLTPLLAPAEDILRRYGGRLPLISNQRANAYLHEVERRLGFRKPLTTHVARHTFATTVALANGVPIETLSRMLGHRDIHTTQIYARVLAQSVADDGAELVAKIL